jgi:hypothetical protein
MMKVWLFEMIDEGLDYDQFSEFVIAAQTKKDAKALVKERLESASNQKIRDFKVREILPALEMAGVLCESYHAG